MAIGKWSKQYLASWWAPTGSAIVFLVGIFGNYFLLDIYGLSDAFFILLVVSLLSTLAAGIYQLVGRSFLKGVLSLLLFAVATGGSIVALAVLPFFGPSEDGFGRDIVVPPGMIVAQPRGWAYAPEEPAEDAEGARLAAVFSLGGTEQDTTNISVDVGVLNKFAGEHRNRLLRHLATSARWHVTEKSGEVYAYRRFVTERERWQGSLNGYYTQHDFGFRSTGSFQFRIIVGLDGPVMGRSWDNVTNADAGAETLTLRVGPSVNRGNVSYLVLRSDGPAMEIYEESKLQSRPFTTLSLKLIEEELTALWRSDVARSRGFDPGLMPTESVNRRDPMLELVQGLSGGGIYEVYGYANPGEQGVVYLKVFEATKNTPLSERRILEKSTEHIGWSDDPDEVFFYNSEVTVYEGDWGVYYPARFEFWFAPASGDPERKLAERIYMIEGWQR